MIVCSATEIVLTYAGLCATVHDHDHNTSYKDRHHKAILRQTRRLTVNRLVIDRSLLRVEQYSIIVSAVFT